MGIDKNHLKIVELAMDGQQEALCQLAEIVHDPLRAYVLRIAFNENIVDDIVQETLLEMFKIFKQLKEAGHFWPWLCKIALNKIRIHSRSQSSRRELLKAHSEELALQPSRMDGLATAINEEFKQCILQAISDLSDHQKAVLSMRCYEDMAYSQIAEVMGISELGCRLQFVRAKKKLQKRLSSLGYGQKSLLAALVLFGKLTASSEAAAAQISVTPTILSVGGIAGGIGLLTSKTVLTAAAGLAVVTGVATMQHHLSDSAATDAASTSIPVVLNNDLSGDTTHFNEGYYLFPQGKYGPLLTRLMVHEPDRLVQVLQNDVGNYAYDVQRQTVTVRNYHYWNPDLSVMTLPTDDPQLESFLAQLEGRKPEPRTIQSNSRNLYIAASGDELSYTPSFGIKNYDALLEERFQYNWPAKITVADHRDMLHQQGWCYFTMKGHLHGNAISGSGRLPFTYAESLRKPAWVKVLVGDEMTLIDTPTAAVVLDASGQPVIHYPSGTFLKGINRPWFGLHVIDTVRRDAAASGISFETTINNAGDRGEVRLNLSEGAIEYRIGMKMDLIEQICFFDATDTLVGELLFDYVNPYDAASDAFRMPPVSLAGVQQGEVMNWLSELGSDNLLSDIEKK